MRATDRALWVLFSRFWTGWRESLTIVQTETVIRWHRGGFRLYQRRKSRSKGSGRPRVPAELRDLIRRIGGECTLGRSAYPRVMMGFDSGAHREVRIFRKSEMERLQTG